ncbi:GATA zinc finger domain-containing protein 24-like [Penaeus vannamei]|uniref:GATA zinc finger domain-containing protein 24-like n=1 Tax=Penaeus vannamei TaxID=6689 RepID=UPI00387F8F21
MWMQCYTTSRSKNLCSASVTVTHTERFTEDTEELTLLHRNAISNMHTDKVMGMRSQTNDSIEYNECSSNNTSSSINDKYNSSSNNNSSNSSNKNNSITTTTSKNNNSKDNSSSNNNNNSSNKSITPITSKNNNSKYNNSSNNNNNSSNNSITPITSKNNNSKYNSYSNNNSNKRNNNNNTGGGQAVITSATKKEIEDTDLDFSRRMEANETFSQPTVAEVPQVRIVNRQPPRFHKVEPQIQAVASFGIAKPPYRNGIPELRAIPESFFAALIVANFILLALFRNLPLAVPFCTKMANRILMS